MTLSVSLPVDPEIFVLAQRMGYSRAIIEQRREQFMRDRDAQADRIRQAEYSASVAEARALTRAARESGNPMTNREGNLELEHLLTQAEIRRFVHLQDDHRTASMAFVQVLRDEDDANSGNNMSRSQYRISDETEPFSVLDQEPRNDSKEQTLLNHTPSRFMSNNIRGRLHDNLASTRISNRDTRIGSQFRPDSENWESTGRTYDGEADRTGDSTNFSRRTEHPSSVQQTPSRFQGRIQKHPNMASTQMTIDESNLESAQFPSYEYTQSDFQTPSNNQTSLNNINNQTPSNQVNYQTPERRRVPQDYFPRRVQNDSTENYADFTNASQAYPSRAPPFVQGGQTFNVPLDQGDFQQQESDIQNASPQAASTPRHANFENNNDHGNIPNHENRFNNPTRDRPNNPIARMLDYNDDETDDPSNVCRVPPRMRGPNPALAGLVEVTAYIDPEPPRRRNMPIEEREPAPVIRVAPAPSRIPLRHGVAVAQLQNDGPRPDAGFARCVYCGR